MQRVVQTMAECGAQTLRLVAFPASASLPMLEGDVMNKLIKIITILISTVFLFGCAPSLQREGYILKANDNKNQNCNIVVTNDQNYKGKIIGKLKIGDTGFSIHCSESDVLKILKDEGCQIGADVVVLKDIKQPDLISSCYRVTGEFIKLDSIATEIKESKEYSSQSIAIREEKGKSLSALGYILGFAIGFSITFFLFSHH